MLLHRPGFASALARALTPGSDAYAVSKLCDEPEPLFLVRALGWDADPEVRRARVQSAWKLSPRRAEVLILIANGDSNKEISEKLDISVNTVEIHVSAILRATGCESRAKLGARFWSVPPGCEWTVTGSR